MARTVLPKGEVPLPTVLTFHQAGVPPPAIRVHVPARSLLHTPSCAAEAKVTGENPFPGNDAYTIPLLPIFKSTLPLEFPPKAPCSVTQVVVPNGSRITTLRQPA